MADPDKLKTDLDAANAENAKLKASLKDMEERWRQERQANKTVSDQIQWHKDELARRDAEEAATEPKHSSPIPQVAPQETKCLHGTERTGEDQKGCDVLCTNKLCKHPCSKHALNCLHFQEVVGKLPVTAVIKGKQVTRYIDDIKKVNCPCTGLSV